MAAGGEEFVLDEEAHARRKILKGSKVKVLENFMLLNVQQIRGDLGVRTACETPLVEFSQHETEQRRSNGHLVGVGSAGGHIVDDAIFHTWGQQGRTQSDHLARLPLAHRQKAQAVLAKGTKVRANAV